MDASEDDQIQAAIRASLAENSKPAASEDSGDTEDVDEEEEEETADWFDSESDSRTGDSSAFRKVQPKEEDVKENPEEPAEPPPPVTEVDDDNDWERHLGVETDPSSSIIFRFPDGSKEQKTLPCTSTLTVCERCYAVFLPRYAAEMPTITARPQEPSRNGFLISKRRGQGCLASHELHSTILVYQLSRIVLARRNRRLVHISALFFFFPQETLNLNVFFFVFFSSQSSFSLWCSKLFVNWLDLPQSLLNGGGFFTVLAFCFRH